MSNLRPGVQIIIDQLANNPDDFFGEVGNINRLYAHDQNPKFAHVERGLQAMAMGHPLKKDIVAGGTTPYWFLTDEERTALTEAYKEACAVRFDAETIATLHAKREPDYGVVASQYGQNLASSLKTSQNAIKASVLNTAFGNAPLKMEGGTI